MTAPELSLHASTLRAVLDVDAAPDTLRAIEAAWGPCAIRRFVAPRAEVRFTVRREGAELILRHPAGELRCPHQDALTPRLEWLLYDAFFEQQRSDGLCVLHAGCAATDGRALVFAGASGSGKSALTRAAIDAGLEYVADEHVVTDGRTLWGVPRSIHLDAQDAEAPSPPWHAGADLTSCRLRHPDGPLRVTPLVHVPAGSVASTPLAMERAVLVAPRRGERDAVSPLPPAARLSCLRDATLVASDALGAIATVTDAFALEWNDPAAALARLLDALSRG